MLRFCFLLLFLLHQITCTEYVSNEGSDFFWEEEPLPIYTRINVALLGLDGNGNHNYKADSKRLQELLTFLLPSQQPRMMDTGNPIPAEFKITYNFKHLPIDGYENALRNAILIVDQKGAKKDYEIIISSEINNYFNGLVKTHFPQQDPNGLPGMGEYTIFIMNPNKQNITPRPEVTDFRYRIRYGANSSSSCQWISDHRYIVTDLAAGPQYYGGYSSDEGIVPPFPLGSHASSVEVEAVISKIVISAIQTVFVPDVQFQSVQHADKILIPIIVLRNHNQWNPLDPESEFPIDTVSLTRQVKKMFLPSQEVILMGVTHGLHEHRHISMALARSKKTINTYSMDNKSRFYIIPKPYIDSETLMYELKHVEDLLAQGLLTVSSLHRSSFFNENVPPLSEEIIKKSQGTHILPVYVFSLIDSPPGTLLTDHQLFHGTKEGVIVLQTNETEVSIPYFDGKTHIKANPKDSTRYILAGIAQAVGGLVEPYRRYNSITNKIISDYTWATGQHPFGPFTTSTSLSQIQYDLILRNVVLSRIFVAVSIMQETMIELDSFVKEYLYNPFAEGISHSSNRQWIHWIDELYHDPLPSSMSPIATQTVFQIHQEVKKFSDKVTVVSTLLESYDFAEAYQMTATLELSAQSFRKWSRGQIEEGESRLLCCYLKHDVMEPPGQSYANLVLVILTFTVVFAVIHFIIKQGQKGK